MGPARQIFLGAAIALSALSFSAHAGVDNPLNEMHAEDRASDCLSNPDCVRMVRKQEAEDKRRQAESDRQWKEDPAGAAIGGFGRLLLGLGGIAAVIWIYTALFSIGDKKKP